MFSQTEHFDNIKGSYKYSPQKKQDKSKIFQQTIMQHSVYTPTSQRNRMDLYGSPNISRTKNDIFRSSSPIDSMYSKEMFEDSRLKQMKNIISQHSANEMIAKTQKELFENQNRRLKEEIKYLKEKCIDKQVNSEDFIRMKKKQQLVEDELRELRSQTGTKKIQGVHVHFEKDPNYESRNEEINKISTSRFVWNKNVGENNFGKKQKVKDEIELRLMSKIGIGESENKELQHQRQIDFKVMKEKMQNQIQELVEKNQLLKTQKEELSKKLTEMEQQKTSFTQILNKQLRNHKQLEQENRELIKAVKENKNKFYSLEENFQSKAKQNQILSLKVKEMQLMYEQFKEEHKNNEFIEREKKVKQYQNYEESIVKKNSYIQKLQKQIVKRQKKILKKDKVIQDLEKNVKSFQQESQQLQTNFQRLFYLLEKQKKVTQDYEKIKDLCTIVEERNKKNKKIDYAIDHLWEVKEIQYSKIQSVLQMLNFR